MEEIAKHGTVLIGWLAGESVMTTKNFVEASKGVGAHALDLGSGGVLEEVFDTVDNLLLVGGISSTGAIEVERDKVESFVELVTLAAVTKHFANVFNVGLPWQVSAAWIIDEIDSASSDEAFFDIFRPALECCAVD